MTTPQKQFFKLYDSLLNRTSSARQAYEQATEAFSDRHDYELYGSYGSFKAALSRHRKQANTVNQLQSVN